MKHVSDGITYSEPKKYKCKVCQERLDRDEFYNNSCRIIDTDSDLSESDEGECNGK